MTVDEQTVSRVAEFHGHMCPGLAMGIRAAEVALAEVGPHAGDEEVVAIVETDMCGVDAVQYLTGCTFGKGNLVHRDYGKTVFTFLRRSDGRAVRVSLRPGGFGPDSESLLQRPVEELYDVQEVDVELPAPARVFTSVCCASCGEPTMETRVRRLSGEQLCQPCFEQRLAAT